MTALEILDIVPCVVSSLVAIDLLQRFSGRTFVDDAFTDPPDGESAGDENDVFWVCAFMLWI